MQLLVKKSISEGVGEFQMLCVHTQTNVNLISVPLECWEMLYTAWQSAKSDFSRFE